MCCLLLLTMIHGWRFVLSGAVYVTFISVLMVRRRRGSRLMVLVANHEDRHIHIPLHSFKKGLCWIFLTGSCVRFYECNLLFFKVSPMQRSKTDAVVALLTLNSRPTHFFVTLIMASENCQDHFTTTSRKLFFFFSSWLQLSAMDRLYISLAGGGWRNDMTILLHIYHGSWVRCAEWHTYNSWVLRWSFLFREGTISLQFLLGTNHDRSVIWCILSIALNLILMMALLIGIDDTTQETFERNRLDVETFQWMEVKKVKRICMARPTTKLGCSRQSSRIWY
jgi:hypothetical protein